MVGTEGSGLKGEKVRVRGQKGTARLQSAGKHDVKQR